MVKISVIPVFNDNYIWLIHDEVSHCAWAVDPGKSAPVIEYCKKNSLSLAGIFITHHHYDHTGGISELTAYANIPVYGPKKENILGVTHKLSAGDIVSLPVGTFNVLDVPGHTLGHIAYYNNTLQSKPILFIGDTLFSAGCGRLFEGSAEMMFQSLTQITQTLPDDTLIFCTHEYTEANLTFAIAVEPKNQALASYYKKVMHLRQAGKPSLPTTLRQEKAINPFLRTEEPEVIFSASSWKGKPLQSASETFAALRQWKDDF